jgi:hypothetical protein
MFSLYPVLWLLISENRIFGQDKSLSVREISVITDFSAVLNSTKFSKVSEKLLNKVSDELFKSVMTESPEDICCYFLGLKFYQRMARRWGPDIILEYCFYQDILNGTVSPEEENVVYNNKMRAAELNLTTKNEPIIIQKNNYRLYTLIKQIDSMV